MQTKYKLILFVIIELDSLLPVTWSSTSGRISVNVSYPSAFVSIPLGLWNPNYSETDKN